MNKVGKIVVLCISIALVGGGVWLAMKDDETPTVTQPTPTPTTPGEASATPPPSNASDDQDAATSVTITYTNDGFTVSGPAKVGAEIKVINNSQRTLQFASDDHPQHTDNSELNLGPLAAGASRTFTISKAGTWGFHDHLNAARSGSIVVQ